MVYTLTLNPALDYTVFVDNLECGKVNRTHTAQISYGGKGINVSAVLSRLGTDNVSLGFFGGFTGDKLLSLLQSDGIKYDFIPLKSGDTRINVKIESDCETDINAQGPDFAKEDIDKLFSKLETLGKNDILCLCGSLPKSAGLNFYAEIMEKLSKKGVSFVVDVSGEALLNTLPFSPLLIKPNKEELENTLKVKLNGLYEIAECAKKLNTLGAKNVLVSLGKDGAMLVNENGIYSAKAPKGRVFGCVGAGDSAVAGFIHAKLDGKCDEECLKYSVACGSATAFSKGLLTKESVDAVLSSVTVNEF